MSYLPSAVVHCVWCWKLKPSTVCCYNSFVVIHEADMKPQYLYYVHFMVMKSEEGFLSSRERYILVYSWRLHVKWVQDVYLLKVQILRKVLSVQMYAIHLPAFQFAFSLFYIPIFTCICHLFLMVTGVYCLQ